MHSGQMGFSFSRSVFFVIFQKNFPGQRSICRYRFVPSCDNLPPSHTIFLHCSSYLRVFPPHHIEWLTTSGSVEGFGTISRVSGTSPPPSPGLASKLQLSPQNPEAREFAFTRPCTRPSLPISISLSFFRVRRVEV